MEEKPKIEVPEAAPILKPILEAAAKDLEEKLSKVLAKLSSYISALNGGEAPEDVKKAVQALEEFIFSYKKLTAANPYMTRYEGEYFTFIEKEELTEALEMLKKALLHGELEEKRDAWRHFKAFDRFVKEFYALYDVTGLGSDEVKAYSRELRTIVAEIGRQFERFKS